MKPLDRQLVGGFVTRGLVEFYANQSRRLDEVKLNDVLRKNPYLFRAKDLHTPAELIESMLDARLSSSEEKMFGDFLESIAIFVSEQTCGGKKSSAQGIDLEFDDDDTRYLVAIKSGTNWGNSSQYQSLEANFKQAVRIQRQAHAKLKIQPVLGMCYGTVRIQDEDTGAYLRKAGQRFWEFISGDVDLYTFILDQIGGATKNHHKQFLIRKATIQAQLVSEFTGKFCDANGQIDWQKLLIHNSGMRK